MAHYIQELLSFEEYSFSLKELLVATGKSKVAVVRELSRLTAKRAIVSVRKGYYLIIPPRYMKSGRLPLPLFVDKLFRHLDREYYLGFYSAAKIYGADHQKVQGDYVMTRLPAIMDIKKGVIDVRFLTTARWPTNNILTRKSDAGNYLISDPALTVIDLIHYQNKLGGLNRVLTTVEELTGEVNMTDLVNMLAWYPHRSTLQRLGYILDELSPHSELAEITFHQLNLKEYFPVLLSPNSNKRPGAVHNRWKVFVNIRLESDV